MLNDGGESPRDVVVLTHPRSLSDPDVIAATARYDGAAAARVFAVAVDGAGEVELSELRRGRPVPVSRCRVELADPSAPARPAARRVHPGLRDAWRGDVEPVPMPFRCGLPVPPRPIGGIGCRLVDFDESGERLLIVGQHEQLYTCRVDGGEGEILPRPTLGVEAVRVTVGVIGVAGGFALLGRHNKMVVLSHYDLPTRTCTTRTLTNVAGPLSWTYFADLHCVVCGERDGERAWSAIDLCPAGRRSGSGGRSRRSIAGVRGPRRIRSRPRTRDLRAAVRWSHPRHGSVSLLSGSGLLAYTDHSGARKSLSPMSNGLPALRRATIEAVQQGGDVLAIRAEVGEHQAIWFLSMSRNAVIGTFTLEPEAPNRGWFALSRDGRRFAYRGTGPGWAIGSRSATSRAIIHRLWSRPARRAGTISPR